MFTKIMKWMSIVALIPALFLWQSTTDYRIVLQFLVGGTAILVALQAGRDGKYWWATAFAVIAVLFNPLAPIAFSRGFFVGVNLLCLTMFLASLVYLKNQARLTIASITNLGPRSEAL